MKTHRHVWLFILFVHLSFLVVGCGSNASPTPIATATPTAVAPDDPFRPIGATALPETAPLGDILPQRTPDLPPPEYLPITPARVRDIEPVAFLGEGHAVVRFDTTGQHLAVVRGQQGILFGAPHFYESRRWQLSLTASRIEFSPGGDYVAFQDASSKAEIWEMDSGKLVLSLDDLAGILVWQPSGEALVAVLKNQKEDGVLSVVEIANPEQRRRMMEVHAGLLAASDDGHVGILGDGSLIDLKTFQLLAALPEPAWARFSALGRWILLQEQEQEGRLGLYDVEKGQALRNFSGQLGVFRSDEEELAIARSVGHGRSEVTVVSLPTGEPRTLWQGEGHVTAMAYHPHSALLGVATGGWQNMPVIRWWDTETGELLGISSAFEQPPHELLFSSNAYWLATVSEDAILVWGVIKNESR